MIGRMTGLLAMLVCSAGAVDAASAQDLSHPYVELGIGGALSGDLDFDGASASTDTGLAGFVSLGFENLIGPLDVRIDYATTDRDYSNNLVAQLQSSSYMVDGLFTTEVAPNVKLYGGAGIGMVDVDFNGGPFFFNGVSGGDTVFGWQLVGGARVRLFNGPLSAFAEARYLSTDDVDVPPNHSTQFSATSVMGGLRWNF